MKSLKRTLCLVLALVMVLGLFGIASATDFTDDNDIQYKEAVEVVTGIGAIKGMDDGTFAPKGTITRAQAATMVARVALTAGVADNLTGIASHFTDVTVEGGFGWAIPSIEYLTGKGIINGMGDGTFNPNGEISGYAVLKMLLCVLGYGVQDEYVGLGWDLQVAIDASRPGVELTKGRASRASYSDPATREEVALYCFNALNVKTVDYDIRLNTYSNAGKETLGKEVYALQTVEGVITENGANKKTAAAKKTTKIDTFTTTGEAAARDVVTYTFDMETGLDLLGHYVKVYYRPATTGNPVGYAVVDESTVVTVTTNLSGAKWDAAFGTDPITIKGYTVGASTDHYAYTFANGVGTNTSNLDITVTDGSENVDNAAEYGNYILYKNAIYSFFPAASNMYTADVVKSYTAPGLTDGNVVIGSTTVTIPKDTTKAPNAAGKDYKLYDGIAKDDVVVLITSGEFVNVVKASSVTGKVSAMDITSTKESITVAGTVYSKGQSVAAIGTTPIAFDAAGQAAVVGKDCTIFLGPDGKVVGVTPVAAADAGVVYAVAYYKVDAPANEFGTKTFVEKVQCVKPDGTQVSYITKGGVYVSGAEKELDGTTTFVDSTATGIMKVSTSYDATLKTDKATLVPVGAAMPAGKVSDTKTHVAGTTDYYNADTVFVYIKGTLTDLKTSVTKTIPNETLAASAGDSAYTGKYFATGTGTNKNVAVVYIVAGKDVAVPGSQGSVVFAPALTQKKVVSYNSADGTTKTGYENTVWEKGTPKTVVCSSASATAATPSFYTTEIDADGVYKLTATTDNVKSGLVTNFYAPTSLISTASTEDGSGAVVAGLDNVSAAGAVVTDVAYALAVASGDTTAVNHATLDSLVGCNVYFLTETTNGVTVVKEAYCMGAGPAARTTLVAGTQGTKGTWDTKPSATLVVAVDGVTVTPTAHKWQYLKDDGDWADASATDAKYEVTAVADPFDATGSRTVRCVYTVDSVKYISTPVTMTWTVGS